MNRWTPEEDDTDPYEDQGDPIAVRRGPLSTVWRWALRPAVSVTGWTFVAWLVCDLAGAGKTTTEAALTFGAAWGLMMSLSQQV